MPLGKDSLKTVFKGCFSAVFELRLAEDVFCSAEAVDKVQS